LSGQDRRSTYPRARILLWWWCRLLTASGITRLLDGLERGGWVCKERCDSDARVAYAALTKDGLKRFEAARTSHLDDIEELFGSNFDDRERATLAELLGRLPLAETSPACTEEETG
jgi:DNA-binding MarR family transcriptional regulator